LPLAGLPGAVTISSRMGRGTDIVPQSDAGLMVIRTFPTIPRVAKQEYGRQGRNGRPGTCIDIINYAEVEKEYQTYLSSHSKRLNEILEEQLLHLEQKLEKYETYAEIQREYEEYLTMDDQSLSKMSAETSLYLKQVTAKYNQLGNKKTSWWLNADSETGKRYLITRSIEQLKHEIKQEQKMYTERKNELMAVLSGQVMGILLQSINEAGKHKALRLQWLETSAAIEALWKDRLTGKDQDNEEVYTEFLEKATSAWFTFCAVDGRLNKGLIDEIKPRLTKVSPVLLERKNKLIIGLRNDVMGIINNRGYDGNTYANYDQLHQQLNVTLKNIESLWLERLRDNSSDDDEAYYEQFLQSSKSTWETFCASSKLLDKSMFETIAAQTKELKLTEDADQQLEDTAAILKFHQWWDEGAQKAYFDSDAVADPGILESVYGGEKFDGLNALYKALLTIEKGDKSYDRQRVQLFGALQNVMDYRSGFLVYLNTYSDIAQQLARRFDNPKALSQDLGCLEHFFTPVWLNEKKVADQKAVDIKKISQLLQMTMNIVTKLEAFGDKDREEKLRQFVTHLSGVIHESFWEKFDEDFAKRIETIFAGDPKVTELLVLNSEEADLHHYVTLIQDSVTTGDDQGKTRRENLFKYLNEHQADYFKQPKLLRPIFEIGLSSRDPGDLNKNLPKPLALKTSMPRTQEMFWSFLLKHSPVDHDNAQKIIDHLHSYTISYVTEGTPQKKKGTPQSKKGTPKNKKVEQKTNVETLELIVEKLKSLPPYIPLQYINKELKSKTGMSNLTDCINQLTKINQAAEQWCGFMAVRGLITSETEPQHPVQDKIQHFDYFKQCFEDMAAGHSEIFFRVAKDFREIDLTRLQKIATAFTMHPDLGEPQLKTMCRLARMIKKLQPESQNVMLEKYESLLKSDPELLGDADARFYQFVEILNKTCAQSNIPDCAVKQLWEAWSEKRIPSSDELSQAIDVVKMGMELQKHGPWNDLFGSLNAPRKQDRQRIMQHLHNKILDLGNDFKSRCYTEYRGLLAKLVDINDETSPSLAYQRRVKDRFNMVLNPFKPLMKLLREATTIAKKPYDGEVEHDPNVNKTQEAHLGGYFLAQKTRYNNYWQTFKEPYVFWFGVTISRLKGRFVNAERTRQANDLFGALTAITAQPKTKAEYYQEALKAILAAQETILRYDAEQERTHKYKLNTKGYSRLHDITMQMLAKVAQRYLTDDGVDFHEREKMMAEFEGQLVFHINMLRDRLSMSLPNHPLIKVIQGLEAKVAQTQSKWSDDSVELADLKQALQTHRKKIPIHLQYLLGPIDLACDFVREHPSESKPGKQLDHQ
jgi:hypothetical protein